MERTINVGPLTSFSSLAYHLGNELDELRNNFINGNPQIPVWDLRNIPPKGASISALTAFLSISKTMRDFIGQPVKVINHWQPTFQGFLSDIGFVSIAREFDLFDWPFLLGGYKEHLTNPVTKTFFYSHIPNIDRNNPTEVNRWKDLKRQEITSSLMFRLDNLFKTKHFEQKWSKNLEAVITLTVSELVVNSLLHGNSIAFVGVQRSGKGISAAVCDSGVGFPKSMSINRDDPRLNQLSNYEALCQASLQSKNKIGLYRAIDDVIKSDGYVLLSSYDSEILWKDNLWEQVRDHNDIEQLKVLFHGLAAPINGFVSKSQFDQGYIRTFNNRLVGSRITFEIPF